MQVTVQAPAKINLTLDVVGVREDGYHLLESIFQAVDRYDTLTAARPQPIAEVTPSKSAPAEEIAPTEDFSNPSTEQIAKNESRPMKNQIEYFEPFETVSFSSREPEPAVKVTASEDFYDDAYGVDNFSDYVPPRRGEEEIPSSDSVFGER